MTTFHKPAPFVNRLILDLFGKSPLLAKEGLGEVSFRKKPPVVPLVKGDIHSTILLVLPLLKQALIPFSEWNGYYDRI